MKIAWSNLLSSATLTASSEKSTLPVENIQRDPLSRKWHTAATVNDAYVLADLGSAQAVRVLALLKTNLTSAATLRVRASNTDAALGDLLDTGVGSPAVPDSAGVDDDYGAVYKILSADVTARYWRIDIADATLDNLQVGRGFMGPAWTPTRSMLYGHALSWVDDSIGRRSDGGQDVFSERDKRRRLQFTLSFMTRAEMIGNAFEMGRARGVTGNVLVLAEESAQVSEYAVYGRCSAPITVHHDTYNVYRARYDVEERL